MSPTTGKAGPESQEIIDARMEYGFLVTNYVALANMFWVGYGAFFTINTLLATGLGLSYSATAADLGPKVLMLLHVIIPVPAIFISIVAIITALEIRKFQRITNDRGLQLEVLLFARIFENLRPQSQKYPLPTILGSLLFMTIWAGALYATI